MRRIIDTVEIVQDDPTYQRTIRGRWRDADSSAHGLYCFPLDHPSRMTLFYSVEALLNTLTAVLEAED